MQCRKLWVVENVLVPPNVLMSQWPSMNGAAGQYLDATVDCSGACRCKRFALG